MDRKSSKDRRLDSVANLHSCEEAFRSSTNLINNVLEDVVNKRNHGQVVSSLRLLAQTTVTAGAMVRKERSRANNEQSALLVAAQKSVEVDQKRKDRSNLKKKNKNNADPIRVEAGKLRVFVAKNKENVKPAAKRGNVSTVAKAPSKRVRLQPPVSIDVAALRYHGPPLLPEGLDMDAPPPPKDLKEYVYTPEEACRILAGVTCEGKRRTKEIKKIIRLHWIEKELVPVAYSTLGKYETKYNRGEPVNKDWDGRGRPRRMRGALVQR